MIYSNLTVGDFKYYKKKLKQIEKSIEAVSGLNGFVVDRERYYAEALVINLNKTDNENLGGNICFEYLDKPGPVKFSLGLVKAQDRGGYRYFKKKSIHDECTIDFFEKNVFDLLDKAFREYDSIRPEDLDSKLELPPRYED